VSALLSRRNQVQWLVLLAVAVLLPTASLLWFMTRVIGDERLVVKQKLAALYQDKLSDAATKTAALFRARLAALDKLKPGSNPYAALRQLVLDSDGQGLLIQADDGALLYPQTAGASGVDVHSDSLLGPAWQAEFAARQYASAAALYGKFTSARDPQMAIAAMTGRSRSLARLGRLDDAIAECQRAALRTSINDAGVPARVTLENARLLLLSLLKQAGQTPAHAALFNQTVRALMADLYNPAAEQPLLPANQNLFVARKTLDALQGPFVFDNPKARDDLKKLADAEELSIAAAEARPISPGVYDEFLKTALDRTPTYALRHRAPSSTLLVLLPESAVASGLGGFQQAFNGSETTYRILDAADDYVAGDLRPPGKPFTVAALPASFPGWTAELYFEGSDVFEKAAKRQIAVYIWTGGVVILMVLLVAALAARAVSRQIRLNRMKNDFIATVSHELKTPLASMRVLVDTLLEGNIRDEAQAQEYLRLTARENERLSRMIDNFLAFSRMERNKQAFSITEADPAEIVGDAVESLRAKHNSQQCHLAVDLSDPLPDIKADHDAIVTVLVNLLDNACKYTAEEKKEISLKVYREGGFVCFAVSDNGIGMARRHLNKIFDSFYQVDNSLARKVEGCGLGLSIVKFIVNAHRGAITVDSKPGVGSTFTVLLPTGHRNGD